MSTKYVLQGQKAPWYFIFQICWHKKVKIVFETRIARHDDDHDDRR